MKKFLMVLCLAAILCMGYLAIALPRGEGMPAMEDIKAETDKIRNQVSDMYEKYSLTAAEHVDEALGEQAEQADNKLEVVVEQADEALENVAEQADEAIENAVNSAVEGAKQGFIQSLKESVSNFFDSLSIQDNQE